MTLYRTSSVRKNCSHLSAYAANVAGNDIRHWADYQTRLDRVIDYIYDHLDERLDLNRLAEVACLSPYHWHRVYHGILGETVACTIRRLRLHRAAGDLVRSEASIRAIAVGCGFNSVQSFSRAFRASFGMSPGEYRSHGIHTDSIHKRKDLPSLMYEVTIQTLPSTKALTCSHTGSYMHIGRAFEHLHAWLTANHAIQSGLRQIAIYYDDPSAVPESDLRSRAGVIFADPGNMPVETPFDETELRGGRYAVLRHKGPYGELARAYQWLYGQWLPQSGEEAADEPVFEEYRNTPQNTAPPDLLTDICMPLR